MRFKIVIEPQDKKWQWNILALVETGDDTDFITNIVGEVRSGWQQAYYDFWRVSLARSREKSLLKAEEAGRIWVAKTQAWISHKKREIKIRKEETIEIEI